MNSKSLIFIAASCMFILLIALFPALVQAQTVGSIGSVGEPGCDPFDEACPIDGGLSLLIAAGIGLAAKKAYDRKKQDIV